MKRKSFLIVFFLVSLCAVIGAFSAPRIAKIRGFFQPIATWTGGHPGNVNFEIGSSNSGFSATRDENGYLSGFFWLGNVGWGTFNQDDSGGIPICRAQIVCPPDVLRNPKQMCPVYGCVWSRNAGWVILSGSSIDGGSGVFYNPGTALIEGFGWSRALGWVPFYAKTDTQELGTDPLTQTGISIDGLAINFIGKIAVIGNIAGTRIFELPNQNIGYTFDISNHAEITNTIRRNIAVMTRNIDDATLEDPLSPLSFLIEKSNDYVFDFAATWPTGKRSIIVIGHDIVLSPASASNYIGAPDGIPRALIALKDANGNGGNIIVSDLVKRIYGFVYAEGSLYSGEKTATGSIEAYVGKGVWNIPLNQLYIKGLLISKNTIGGAQQSMPTCPVVITNCSSGTAELYDLNFFRSFDATEPSQRSLPYSDPRLDKASFIIEYDSNFLSNIPPGLDSILQ